MHVWVEGDAAYHLIDGYAMRELWGKPEPSIIFNEENLEKIFDKIRQCYCESDGTNLNLSPRMNAIRFAGGSIKMDAGYNLDTYNPADMLPVISFR